MEGPPAADQAEGEESPCEYVRKLRERLDVVRQEARQNLERAQDVQKQRYDAGTRLRTFTVGDRGTGGATGYGSSPGRSLARPICCHTGIGTLDVRGPHRRPVLRRPHHGDGRGVAWRSGVA
ncbi:UNVERIFIED_CONTAM: hypothetical protein K2H54_055228 [Gekko kuhli]